MRLALFVDNLEADHLEMKQKLDQMQSLAISLQVQLSTAQTDLNESRTEKERLVRERAVEKQALQDALDAAIMERAENDAKWQRDFEQLRTLNSGERVDHKSVWYSDWGRKRTKCLIRISDREELLLQDCEWKIRETERNCKKRVDAAEVAKKDALQKSEEVAVNAKTQTEQVSTSFAFHGSRHEDGIIRLFLILSQAKKLKNSEAEVNALRGLTGEQRESISFLTQQLELIKNKLDDSTRQLEESRAKIHKMAVKFAS